MSLIKWSTLEATTPISGAPLILKTLLPWLGSQVFTEQAGCWVSNHSVILTDGREGSAHTKPEVSVLKVTFWRQSEISSALSTPEWTPALPEVISYRRPLRSARGKCEQLQHIWDSQSEEVKIELKSTYCSLPVSLINGIINTYKMASTISLPFFLFIHIQSLLPFI